MNSAFKFFTDVLTHLRNISEHTGENVNVVPRFFKITSYHLNQQVVDKDHVSFVIGFKDDDNDDDKMWEFSLISIFVSLFTKCIT